MITDKEIAKFTLKQLSTLSMKIEAAKKAKRLDERDRIKAQVAKMVKESGFSIDEVLGAKPKRKSTLKKVFHPTDKSVCYGGRGPKPKWLKEMEARS